MKILQLIDSLEAGGAERMAVQLANELAATGHDSFLCATRKEGLLKQTIQAHVHYLFADKKGKLGLSAVLRIRAFVKKHGITIIHAHSSSFFTAVLVKLLRPGIKLVWHDHYGNAEQLQLRPRHLLASTSRIFNGVISVNETLKLWSEDNLHVHEVRYFRNFVSHSGNEQEGLITALPGIAGKRVIHLANLREQKDHLTLFKAFEKLLTSYPEWTLLLVGQDFEDRYSQELHGWVAAHNLSSHIKFLGTRLDVTAILKDVSLGVLSSKSEGLPVALLEYGLAALPVVVTDVGACKEVVQDYGYLVPAGDVNALFQGLMNVLTNLEESKLRGIRFQRHVSTTFGAQAYITQLVAFYKHIS